MSEKLTAHVTLTLNHRIMGAECPVCRDALPVSDLFGTRDDQLAQLQEIFERHIRIRHADLLKPPI